MGWVVWPVLLALACGDMKDTNAKLSRKQESCTTGTHMRRLGLRPEADRQLGLVSSKLPFRRLSRRPQNLPRFDTQSAACPRNNFSSEGQRTRHDREV